MLKLHKQSKNYLKPSASFRSVNKIGQLIKQLNTTKRQMEATQLHSHTQAALTKLVQSQKLKDEYYWPYIPGVPEDSN